MKKALLIVNLKQGEKIILPNMPNAKFSLSEPFYLSLSASQLLTPMEYDLKTVKGQQLFKPQKAGTFCLIIESEEPLKSSQITIGR